MDKPQPIGFYWIKQPTPLIPLLNGTCIASTCKIVAQGLRKHLAAIVILLSKCNISNLDIIADQDQNITHPPQFDIIINGICKWYSWNMSWEFLSYPCNLSFCCIISVFWFVVQKMMCTSQCSSCQTKWVVASYNQIYSYYLHIYKCIHSITR